MRFRRDPVPTLMILLANSTPIVWDDKTRHSFLTKRCSRQDLYAQRQRQPCLDSGMIHRRCSRGVLGVTHFPVPLGPKRMILAR